MSSSAIVHVTKKNGIVLGETIFSTRYDDEFVTDQLYSLLVF